MDQMTYHLLGHHDHSLDGESAAAMVEKILQRGSQQVYHQDVVKALLAEVIDIGNTGYKSVSRRSGTRTAPRYLRHPTRIL